MNQIKRTFKQYWLLMKINILNAAELRGSFIMDVLGMMLNNLAFIVIWIFFFNTVGKINSWGPIESVGLEGMVAFAYGVAFAFMGGVGELPSYVNSGHFDNFLVSPTNLYVRIITGGVKVTSFGDFLYGIIFLTIFSVAIHISLLQFVMLVVMMVAAGLLAGNFVLCSGLIAFLVPDASDAANSLFELMVTPALYPSKLLSQGMRIFFFLVIPALVIGGMPIETIINPNWGIFLAIIGLSVFWFALAIYLMNKAVRKYESGNLVGFKG